jgi:ADP-heptose:LPS heptosyltransferase
MRIFVFKPDAIGDFLLATGAIRLLAEEHGESSLVLAVRDDVAPLASREFPRACVIPLPLRQKKGQLALTANILRCLPAWAKLRAVRCDAAACLRSMRTYLHTFLFHTPRAGRRVACTNDLTTRGGRKRIAVERWAQRRFRPELIPYPAAPGDLPLDIEANRLVVEALLGRSVTREEILPRLRSATWSGAGGFWLLCPFSSTAAKDYTAEAWADALADVADLLPPGGLRLSGGPGQDAPLHAMAGTLRARGLGVVEVAGPGPLADFPSVVAQSALVLTVDTAAAHFACALGAPCVVVSANRQPGVYGPYSTDGRQLWLMADRHTLGKRRWRETLPPPAITAAIRCALVKGKNDPLLIDL